MMNLNTLKDYYYNSPLWLKKLYASIPFDIRNGTDYRNWKHFLQSNCNTEEYELLKLKETLVHAYENTPFYYDMFTAIGAHPNDVNSPKELSLLPLINKQTVKENFNAMTARNINAKDLFFVTTGGSSGQSTKFLQSKNVWAKESAFIYDYFKKYGYSVDKMKKASLRGGNFNGLAPNVFWKFNPIYNEIQLSPFHLSNDTVRHYVDILNKEKPAYLHGYPSTTLALVKFMQDNHLELFYQIDTIFLISEDYTDKNIADIKSFFNCRVTTFFGHSERLIFAGAASEDLKTYQIDRRYGLFELLDETGKSISQEGVRGEMVGTSFDNFAQPLIRYKTSDMSTYESYESRILTTIKGERNKEFIVGKNDETIFLIALNVHTDDYKNIIDGQFVQTKKGNIDFNIVVNNSFQEHERQTVLNILQDRAGFAVDFNVNIVPKLEVTHRGKVLPLVQKL
jgi:phenylacetate-CoA ligase